MAGTRPVEAKVPIYVGPVDAPGFSHALRWSASADALTTYRMRLPMTESGDRLRVSFKAGDGVLTIARASVARAGTQGALASAPVPVRFAGSAGASAQPRSRVTSDWVVIPVERNEELYISFEVTGALAASAITNYPDSWARYGSYAMTTGAMPGAVPQPTLVGVSEVAVESDLTTPSFLAIGDSITEGYMAGPNDDIRQSWPFLLARSLGVPVAVAGVSGQGVEDATKFFSEDIAPLENVTDCIVLLGTNDLHAYDVTELARRTEAFYDLLRPRCRVWGATLVPKERTSRGTLPEVNQVRNQFNAWLRTQARVDGVVDFEAVLRTPGSPDDFGPGLETDGIHPSAAGHAKMGQAATDYFRAKNLSPTR